MAINYLISIDNLKRLGLIHDNVDPKLLSRCIKLAQDQNIQNVTGTPLFNELIERVENDNWSEPYTSLMNEHVLPALVAWVDYHACSYLNIKITNKNVGRGQDDERTANTDLQTSNFQKKLMKDAKFYNDRLFVHLQENCDLYPEYDETTDEDVKKQKKKTGISGVVI